MDRQPQNTCASVEQPPSHRVGLVELGHGTGPLLGLDGGDCLALWLRRQEQTGRQQLREWCDEAEAKRGDQRQALDPQAYVVPLRQWIISLWQGSQLALALDATTWGTRFTLLAISVV